MKPYIVLIAILISFVQGMKADGVDWPKIMPRTPDVSALEKYGTYPVGYQTGTVNISVPFFNVPIGHNMSLPVGITYHSSGIKVAEQPSRVGLGWALQAGGCISREVRGLKDETPISGHYNFINAHIGHKFQREVYPDTHAALLDSIDRGIVDSEPDLFHVSLPTCNFSFFYGSDGNFHCIPFSNVRISQTALANNQGLGNWVIIDEQGIRYYFGQYDGQSAIEYSAHSQNRIVTAWKLMSIVSPEGKLLAEFSYGSCDYFKSNSYHCHRFSDTQVSEICGEWNGSEELFGQSDYTSSYSFDGYDLTSICIPGCGCVTFHSRTPRLEGTSVIDKIVFSDSISGRTYGYSLSYDNTKRCFLNSIDKFDSDNHVELFRQFSYFPGFPIGTDDRGQDYWGYYNGAQNAYLYPISSYFDHRNAIPHSDRYPNEHAFCGSLKDIIYPTGGKTTFTYSNNDIFVPNYRDTIYSIQAATQSINANTRSYEGDDFTQAIEEMVSFDIEFEVYSAIETISFQLVDAEGYAVCDYTDVSLIPLSTRVGTSRKYTYHTTMVLRPGTYHWIVSHESKMVGTAPFCPTTIQTQYYAIVANTRETVDTKRVGGIRIQQVSNYDSDGSLIERRDYSYIKANGESSGHGGPEPFFVRRYIEQYLPIGESAGASINDHLFVGVEEVGEENLCRYSGSAVLYSDVTEEVTADGTTLRTTYHYGNRSYGYPSVRSNTFHNEASPFPFDENNYQEGILLSKTVYEQTDNGFQRRLKEEYLHSIQENSPQVFVQTGLALQNMVGGHQDSRMSPWDYYYCGTYQLTSAKVLSTGTTTTEYVGQDSIVVNSRSFYGNPDYTLPTRTETYVTPTEKTTTDYSYCFDAPNNNVMRQMVTKNIIASPIEVENTYKGQSQTVKTEYGYFNNEIIEPTRTMAICLGDTTMIEYLQYDKYGNPLHIRMNGVVDKFYLWAYGGKLPVAEIIGGQYSFSTINSAVRSISGMDIRELSNYNISTNGRVIQTLTNGYLQNAFPKANVTTLTYDNINGTASVTNTNGVTTLYEYDAFSRLSAVLLPIIRNGGNIEHVLKESYQYHYRTQP